MFTMCQTCRVKLTAAGLLPIESFEAVLDLILPAKLDPCCDLGFLVLTKLPFVWHA
jgi:ferredoxin